MTDTNPGLDWLNDHPGFAQKAAHAYASVFMADKAAQKNLFDFLLHKDGYAVSPGLASDIFEALQQRASCW